MNIQKLASKNLATTAGRAGLIGGTAVLVMILLLAPGCASQATFRSAEAAVDSLVAAARTQDPVQLSRVLGPEADDIVSSGDKTADQKLLARFLSAYDEKHQLVPAANGAMTLVVGSRDWPMPIPIVKEDGKWRFDTAAGKEEIINRRIGRNELSAIQTCQIILDAQREYKSRTDCEGGYAARFVSDPGRKNGLYWPVTTTQPASPLGPFAAAIASEGYSQDGPAPKSPRPYHGYRFRIMTSQGAAAPGGAMDYQAGGKMTGFAVVAWPVEYGNSGIMTFIMNHDGTIYERDLGEDAAQIAESMNSYDPGPEWKKVEPGK